MRVRYGRVPYLRDIKINNLIGFVDYNKKQLDGWTKDICDLGDIDAKFREFGWYAN